MKRWFSTFWRDGPPRSCPSKFRCHMRLGYANGEIEPMIDKWNDAGASIPTTSTRWDSSWPRFVDTTRRIELIGWFTDRFGVSPSFFAGFAFLETRQAYWLLSDSPHLDKLRRLRVHRTGVPVLRKIQNRLKPTTSAVRLFGNRATRNVVDLDRAHLMRLLRYGEIHLSSHVTPGYVIVSSQSQILGCGLFTGRKLLNQIPRGYRPYP